MSTEELHPIEDAHMAEDLKPESMMEDANDVSPVSIPERKNHNLLVRTGAGFIYIAINIVCFALGTVSSAICMSVTAGICCWEFFRLMRADFKKPNQIIGIFFAALMPLIALINTVYLIGVLFLMLMILGLWYVINQRARITDIAITFFGAIYTGMTLSALVGVRCSGALERYGAAILCIGIMFSVWFNDAFAFLVGSAIGRHKMFPRISPKKTWEGFAGGMAGSILFWCLLLIFPSTHITVGVAIVCGILCGITGVIGDLVESRIKRGSGVKDSGNLIPGHGGLLDRSDSMLFVAITAYFLLLMMDVI